MNLPSKAVLEFSFPLFALLLLHFVSSFPFYIYKQLVRKEVFPVVQISELQTVISQLSNVLDRSLFRSLSNRNFSLTPAMKNKRFLNKPPLIWLQKLWVLLRFLPQTFQILSENLELLDIENNRELRAAREFVFKVIDNLSWVIDFYWSIGHVRYINIQAWLRGFRVKIANF